MLARPYTPNDFEQIQSWASHRGDTYQSDLLPETGFIVDGFAAYFCYLTNSKVCFLENMIANPGSDPIKRDEALKLVTEACISFARSKDCQIAYACTNIPKIIERAVLRGSKAKANYVLLTLNLNKITT